MATSLKDGCAISVIGSAIAAMIFANSLAPEVARLTATVDFKEAEIRRLEGHIEELRNQNDRLLALLGDLKREGYRPDYVADPGFQQKRELTPEQEAVKQRDEEILDAIMEVAGSDTALQRQLNGYAEKRILAGDTWEEVVGSILQGGAE